MSFPISVSLKQKITMEITPDCISKALQLYRKAPWFCDLLHNCDNFELLPGLSPWKARLQNGIFIVYDEVPLGGGWGGGFRAPCHSALFWGPMCFLSVWQNYCVPVPPFSPLFIDSNFIIAKKESVANLGYLWNHGNTIIWNYEEICRIF